jgi:hypothetical protein
LPDSFAQKYQNQNKCINRRIFFDFMLNPNLNILVWLSKFWNEVQIQIWFTFINWQPLSIPLSWESFCGGKVHRYLPRCNYNYNNGVALS